MTSNVTEVPNQNNTPIVRNLKRGCESPDTYAYAYSFRRPKTVYRDDYPVYQKRFASNGNSKIEVFI